MWFGCRYKTTLGTGPFFFKSTRRCSFESMIPLDSLFCPSWGFSSCLSINSTSDAIADSTINYFAFPCGPFFLTKRHIYNVIFLFLYHNFKNFFCTLIFIVLSLSKDIQNNIHIIHIYSIKIECNTYLSRVRFKYLKN
jgi:hypothetical protein